MWAVTVIIKRHTVPTDRPLSDKEIVVLKQNLKQLDKRKLYQVKFLIFWRFLQLLLGQFSISDSSRLMNITYYLGLL